MRRDPRQFGEEGTRWTLDRLRGVCDWLRLRTAPGLSQLLKRLKVHDKRGRARVHSPDDNYLPKLREVQVCVRRSPVDPELVVVLFQDEFTFYRQPTLAAAYEFAGHVQPLAHLSHRSNVSWRVVATLNALTGRVIYTQAKHIGIQELVAFYAQVQAAYAPAQTIYMVQDNWPVHHHPDVLAALKPQTLKWPKHVPANWPTEPSAKAKRLNLPIELVQLPTYASWTNPIEKLWRKLCQDELHLHRLADDWPALKLRVATFLDQFAQGSRELLRYVGLSDLAQLYHSAFHNLSTPPPLRC